MTRADPATAAGAATRVQLLLTLRAAGDRDVAVDADARATVSELADALGRHADARAAGVLFSDRLGRLGPDVELGACGLLTGDVVSLAEPVAGRTPPPLGAGPPVATLMATGGPGAGLRVGLAAGRYVVGRDPGCDIRIADASLSGRHFEVEIDAGGGCRLGDAGSRNGTAIEGVGLAPGAEHWLTPGEAVEAGRSTFTCEPRGPLDSAAMRRTGAGLSFARPGRESRDYAPAEVRIEPPPAPLRGGPSSSRRERAEDLVRFEGTIRRLEAQLAEIHAEELAERRAAAPHAADLAARAILHLPDLWERRPGDDDFLDVRLGAADQSSVVAVSFAAGGDQRLRDRVEDIIDAHAVLPLLPVAVRVTETGAIGLVGARPAIEPLARWLVVQFATLHSPRDVVVCAALSHERGAAWSWLSWLPHTAPRDSPLKGAHVAAGEQPARDLLRRVAALAAERRADFDGRKRASRRTTVVVLADGDVEHDGAVVRELLANCAHVDIAVVWLAREERHVPAGCGVVVRVSSERAVADVEWTGRGVTLEAVSVDGIAPELAEAVARSLAPVDDGSVGDRAPALAAAARVEVRDIAP